MTAGATRDSGSLSSCSGSCEPGERLALVLRRGQRPRHVGRDAHALPGRAAVSLALPAREALHLVVRVEAFALEQALGEQQRHGGVVGPGAARQIEGPAAQQVADGREAARLAELGVRGQRIAHREPDQRALESLAQRARRVQHLGRLQWDRRCRQPRRGCSRAVRRSPARRARCASARCRCHSSLSRISAASGDSPCSMRWQATTVPVRPMPARQCT